MEAQKHNRIYKMIQDRNWMIPGILGILLIFFTGATYLGIVLMTAAVMIMLYNQWRLGNRWYSYLIYGCLAFMIITHFAGA